MRYVFGLLLLLALAAGGTYIYAGRMPGPTITIAKPEKYVGQTGTVEVAITAPRGELADSTVTFEQNGKQTPLASMAQAGGLSTAAGPDTLTITRTFRRTDIPDLKSGPARIVVTATRPVLYKLRKTSTTVVRDVQVRLERPQVAVLSTKHYINLGGSEMVVYRATPADVESGVQVGDLVYPGYPASGAKLDGVNITDPAVKLAFIAL